MMDTYAILGLDKSLLNLNYFSIAIAFYFTFQKNKLNSTLLSLSIMIFFNTIMTSYTPDLYAAAIKYQAEYKHHFRILWYLGFAFIEFMVFSLVLFSHERFNLERSFCANVVIISYFIKMNLQLISYAVKEINNNPAWDQIYRTAIPYLNIIFASIIFGYVITVSLSIIVRKTTKFKGLSWSI